MSERVIPDHAERALARDPRRSVIVQAPAGSGKTELLMQRYLALLDCVTEPEEILAVTFTRKAAAEMRNRILQALQPDVAGQLPETADLAKAVLRRNVERGWQLHEFPGRLRIRTLDSVNSWLRDSAPLSGEGVSGTVAEQDTEHYELAASRTLELVCDDSELGVWVGVVLRHLDNRAERFVSLIAQMLARRDQWLPLLGRGDLGMHARDVLESSLQMLVGHALEKADQLLAPEVRQQLHVLLGHAATHLLREKPDELVCAWRDCATFPTPEPANLLYWRGLADFLLVREASSGPALRKKLNKSNGFPTPKDGGSAELNALAHELLERLAGNAQLVDALAAIRALPEPTYSDSQWEALEALVRVLPAAAAQLLLVFRERGQTDYIQIAGDALQAFGTEETPTDLALRLDYRISHILIDEFQDTSRTQFELLKRLTAGWVDGDGRTLFVVGDPMQSIYRFRQAEVALFIRLWEQGIGALRLEPVRLTANFRSAPPIVEWVNTMFAALLPAHNDPATGAVQFAQGLAIKPADSAAAAPQLHPCAEPGRVDEARAIVDLVEATLQNSSSDTVGILVRTRHQARLLVPELRRRGIPFAGQGLEQPGETAVEQDLLALTRALSHVGDRTAWLALLRAPWCGLSLADIAALCGQDWRRTVYEQLHDATLISRLSPDGQARLHRFIAKLPLILQQAGKLPMRDRVEGAWQYLGGPAALSDPRDLQLAAQYFATLEQFDEGGNIAEAWRLHERLAEREDLSSDRQVRVHLLTIYKAKGLEYDTVILPALDGTTRRNDKAVLAWHEITDRNGTPHYLMAPVEGAGEEGDRIHQLIRGFETEQISCELDRLLYVATTRAKKQLHLFFELRHNKDGDVRAPRKGSLLSRLWPIIHDQYRSFSASPGQPEAREEWIQPKIRRLLPDCSIAPPAGVPVARLTFGEHESAELRFDWAGSDAMRIGTVVHRCLQYIAEQQLGDWFDAAAIRGMLIEEGVTADALDRATEKVQRALQLTLADERGRWLLAARQTAVCEYALTVSVEGELQRIVIDRSFIDDDGVRWIIDYKSSTHEGGNLEGFIDTELQRYGEQLLKYRDALQLLEPDRRIRTALYFPLLQTFRELRTQSEPAS